MAGDATTAIQGKPGGNQGQPGPSKSNNCSPLPRIIHQLEEGTTDMGGVSKGSGNDRGASKGPGNDVKGISTESASVWEKNLSGHGRNDGGSGGSLPQYLKIDYGDDGAARKRQGMGVGLGGCSAGGDRALDDEGVCAKAAGKNCGVYCR